MKLADLKGKYLAFVLDAESRERLLSITGVSFAKVLAHHMTLVYPKADDDYLLMRVLHDRFDSTGPHTIIAHSYALGDGVECVACSFDGADERYDGSFFHITISVQPPHKPVESNTLEPLLKPLGAEVRLTGKLEYCR